MATSALELQNAVVPCISSFLHDQHPPSRTSTSSFPHTSMAYANTSSFDQDVAPEILDYLFFDKEDSTNRAADHSDRLDTISDRLRRPAFDVGSGSIISSATETSTGSAKRRKTCGGERIGFRTKTEVDVLDDGYKWKKYGKKSVKNSPNPRNYYRCASEGCGLKKRVERDGEDDNYVITTYHGVHNHDAPPRTAADGGKQLSHYGLVWPPPHHDSLSSPGAAEAPSIYLLPPGLAQPSCLLDSIDLY